MATVLAGNKNNIYTWALSTSAKTLTFSNITGFDLEVSSLQSVWSTNAGKFLTLGVNVVSCTLSYVAGLPVYTYLFGSIDSGIANGDTLIIRLQIPDAYLDYSALLYIAGATI